MLVGDSSRTLLVQQTTSRSQPDETVWEKQKGKAGGNLPTVSLTPAYGSKLADALWSMETNGIVQNQKPEGVWYGGEPEPKVSDEFMKLSSMTPAERIRYFFLDDQELDEDKLAAMTPQDQEAIEEQIRQLILERLGLKNEDGKSGDEAAAPAPEAATATTDIVSS